MAMYRPTRPFNVPLVLYTVAGTTEEYGKTVKEYATPGALFYGSFVTYGGTERESNGLRVVEDTATVETWYRPDITAGCRVALAENPDMLYEIVGTPEDIEQRHQFCKFKLTRVSGGA